MKVIYRREIERTKKRLVSLSAAAFMCLKASAMWHEWSDLMMEDKIWFLSGTPPVSAMVWGKYVPGMEESPEQAQVTSLAQLKVKSASSYLAHIQAKHTCMHMHTHCVIIFNVNILKYLFILYVVFSLHACMHTACLSSSLRSQRRATDPLEPELQRV